MSSFFRFVLVCALALPLSATAEEGPASTCNVDTLFDDARAGLAAGSPALRRYLRELLVEAALVTPDEVLLRQLEREDDPAMIEALAAALANKAETVGDATLVAGLLKRALQDTDPARRAAAVRGLKGTGSVELMRASGTDVDYERLIRDESPEVRAAVVENLVVEDEDVYSGHSAELSEAALAVAAASEDKAAAARLIEQTSTEAIGSEAVTALTATLEDEDPSLRAAAARALGGVSPANGKAAVPELLARYRTDDDLDVRRAILGSLARLERTRAVPHLTALRPVDARLHGEIDAWIAVLEMGLPEWHLIVREKSRL